VLNRFSLGFSEFLASQHGYCVYSCDGRGTGLNNQYGNSHMYAVYRRLGVFELEDQLEFGRWIRSQGSTDRPISLWGWSYGGFMAAMVFSAGRANDVFGKLVSVAPVTSWAYYDTAYTERFMREPQNNTDGYAETSIMARVTNQTAQPGGGGAVQPPPPPLWAEMLLVHGTADDNVHFQHAAVLNAVLTARNVQLCTNQFYTDEDHGLGTATRHLYTMMVDFLSR